MSYEQFLAFLFYFFMYKTVTNGMVKYLMGQQK
jgi:hypothetical protein